MSFTYHHRALNPHCRLGQTAQNRRGAVLVLVVLFMPVILILAGFAINWAYLQLVQTEMQVATDAAVRAATRVYMQTGNLNAAVAEAQNIADRNLVSGSPLQLRMSDFEVGISLRSHQNQRYLFSPTGGSGNSLRLTVEKSAATPSGPVRLVFPMLQGPLTVNMTRSAVATQLELDIVLVIDRSGSMAYAADEIADYPPIPRNASPGWFFGDPAPPESRWLDTVDAVQIFLQELLFSPHREQVALVTYADTAQDDHDLTENYSEVFQKLQPYTKRFNSGATNIGEGMLYALNRLANSTKTRPWAAKVVVVMTDGIFNVGPDPRAVAYALADQGIMIFTVTFADEANQEIMRDVARIGKGLHFHANSSADIRRVFREVAKIMPTLLTR